MASLAPLYRGQEFFWPKFFLSDLGDIDHKANVGRQLTHLQHQLRRLNALSKSFVTQCVHNLDPNTSILIWDTGPSFGVAPF